MKRFSILMGLCILVLAGCGDKQEIVTGADRYLDPDQLTAGMKGFGRTVFKGDTLEDFEVEIIGVLSNWAPGSDLILAELHHPVTDEAGVIAGMSGSPIFINGRLIGALAYGWRYQKRAICGITPIKDMLLKAKSPASARRARIPDRDVAGLDAGIAPNDIVPLAIPMTVSNVSPRFKKFMEAEYKKRFGREIMLVSGGQGGQASSPAIGELKEGSAVAVKLIEGDIDMAGVGTVTCIDGDTVYAFGHPMSLDGTVDLPMAKAWIHTVIASSYSSFKLSSTGATVGTINYDYSRGIRGIRGQVPDMIPVKATIENVDTGGTETYNFKVVNDKHYTGYMVFIALYYAISESTIVDTDISAWTETRLQAEGLPLITARDFFTTTGNPGFSSAYPLVQRIDYLMDNPLKPVRVKSVDLSIRVAAGRQVKVLERFMTDKRRVKPGDEIEIVYYVRRYAQPPARETMRIKIPADIPEGIVRLNIYNGLSASRYDQQRAPGLSRVERIEQVAERLSDPYDANTLVIEFNTQERGMVIEGEEFEDVPASVLSVYSGLGDSRISPTNFKLWRRDTVLQKEVFIGDMGITLQVSKYNP